MKKQLFLRLACFSAFILLSLFSVLEVKAESILKPSSYYMNVPDDEDNSYYIQPSDTNSSNPWYGLDYINGFGYRSYWSDEFNQGDTLKFQVRLCSANPDFGDIISSIYSKVTSYTYNTTNAATGATVGDPNSVLVSYNKYNSNCGTFNFTILNPISGRYYGFELSFNTSIRISPSSTTSGYLYIPSSQAVVTEGTNAYIELMNEQSKQNTQDIINNQNQNNEELKESIDKNFNSCTVNPNLFTAYSEGYIPAGSTSSTLESGTNAYTTDWINSNPNTLYTIIGGNRRRIQFKNSKGEIKYYPPSPGMDDTSDFQFTTDIDTVAFRIYFASDWNGSFDDIYIMEGTEKEICVNNVEEQVKTSKGILGTLKSVFTSIIELPKKIVDLLVDGLKSLFVPDSNEMNQLIDNFKETTSQKLGVIYQAGDLLIGIFQNIIDDNTPEKACLTFPQLKLPDVNQPIIEETDFCFNEITDKIPILLTTIRGVSGVFITLTFINMLKKKYDDFINGGEL